MDRERLARVLGMLGSSHDGEVLNAARVAVRIVKDAGTTWEQAITPNGSARAASPDMNGAAVEAARVLLSENDQLRDINRQLGEELARLRARQLRVPASWRKPRGTTAAITQAIEWTEILSDWERQFVTDIAGCRSLTQRQQDRLTLISQKIERFAYARGIAA